MVKINYEGQIYQIKNKIDEMFINEYENICSFINNDKLTHMDKWSKVLVYLGVPEDVVDDFDAIAFKKIIEQFNLIKIKQSKIFKDLKLDRMNLVSYEDKFKLSVKELGLIEKACKDNKDFWIAEVMAIIYKNPEVDSKMKYDSAHLKYKAECIRKEITADKCVPILDFLSKRIIKDYEMITNND